MESDREEVSVKWLLGFIAAAVVALLALLWFLPDVNQYDQRDKYCQMVEAWHNDTMTPPEHRAGWPDYRGNYEDVCK